MKRNTLILILCLCCNLLHAGEKREVIRDRKGALVYTVTTKADGTKVIRDRQGKLVATQKPSKPSKPAK